MLKNVTNIFKKRNKKTAAVKKYCVGMCIPGSRDFISTESVFSILGLSVPAGVSRILTSKDIQPINHCRNVMIEETLRNPDVTHILMLEPGVKVHPGLLWELFANPTDIVAVPCFDDEKPFHPNIYKAAEIGYNKIVDFDVDPKIRKIQVDACDPGCVLIARHVIESVGKFRYNDDYFRSDMFLFTEKAKQMGFEITATTVVHCHRIKTLEVGYNFFKEYRAIEQLKNKKTDDTKNLFQ